MTSNPPSSPVETTGGDSGTTEQPHPVGARDELRRINRALARELQQRCREVAQGDATIGRLGEVISAYVAELAERDTTIEALTAKVKRMQYDLILGTDTPTEPAPEREMAT
jgi:hypothetical protein